jgi:hypothetical protein
VIRDLAVQSSAAEPAIGEIEMDFPAQPPFRPDAHAVSDDQHPHHQFWIDRGTANLAVERPQLRAHALEVEELIDAPNQVVAGHLVIETEIVEQPRRRYLRPVGADLEWPVRIALRSAARS